MKTLFLSLLIFLFSACSQLSPVASDICKITEEICYYANAICELYAGNPGKESDPGINYQLQKSNYILQNISVDISRNLLKEGKKKNPNEITPELIEVRNNLKNLYEKLKGK